MQHNKANVRDVQFVHIIHINAFEPHHILRAAEAVTERAELGKRGADRRASQAETETAGMRKQLKAQKLEHTQVWRKASLNETGNVYICQSCLGLPGISITSITE